MYRKPNIMSLKLKQEERRISKFLGKNKVDTRELDLKIEFHLSQK